MRKDISFCLNDAYVNFCYITIYSILENKKSSDEFVFHLLTDFISDKNTSKIEALVNDYNAEVKFYEIDKKRFEGLNMNFSVYAWFRILIPEVIDSSIKKVLYLDCDTIVDNNLDALFNIDISGKSIACAIDREAFNSETFERLEYDSELKYVCTGVMMMNADYWRNNSIGNKVYNFGKENPSKCVFADQDAINYICRATKMLLPLKYGIINNYFSESYRYEKNEVLEAVETPVIIHYAGNAPWKYSRNFHFFGDKWWSYKKRVNLGFMNNITRTYIKTMFVYYRRLLMFVFFKLKPYPYKRPEMISRDEVLNRLNVKQI
ncbi:glycosyltransferase family 8 protein [Flavobacteriaceae bacterium MHTCC 0001]